MSKLPGIAETLDALEGLKSATRDFTTRASKLREELRVRTIRAGHHQKTTLEEITAKLTADLAEEDAKFQDAISATNKNYEKRKARLGKAYRTSKELGLAKVEERVGQRKYGLQRQMLQAERDRDSGLANLAAALDDFRKNLAAADEALNAIEFAARNAFKGYGKWSRLLSDSVDSSENVSARDEHQILTELQETSAKATERLGKFRSFFLLRLFRYPLLWLLLLGLAAGSVPLLQVFGIRPVGDRTMLVYIGGVSALVLIFLLRGVAMGKAAAIARDIAGMAVRARQLHELAAETSETHYQSELMRINNEYKRTSLGVDQELKQALSGGADLRARSRTSTDEKTFRVTARHEQLHKSRLERFEREHADTIQRLNNEAEAKQRALVESNEANEKRFKAEYEAQWQALENEWRSRTQPLFEALGAARARAENLFPAWDKRCWESWTPPGEFAEAAKFGELKVDLERTAEATAESQPAMLDGQSKFSVPLCLTYPRQGSLLFETGNTGREQAVGSLNNIILRLLSVAPPGRLNFTIIDPVGLGQNFAGVMHLADYEEQIIHNKIWTQSTQIEQRLGELNEHMEKVIQMYLRNEYATIAEYNEKAGVIAEKYQFLVVADFPVNFSDMAARRLLNIAGSGARCGVYLLMHWDLRQPSPQDFVPEELRKSAVRVTARGSELLLEPSSGPGTELALEAPPLQENAIEFIQAVGQSSRDSSRVEVPFSQVTPGPEEIWTEETTSELRVPIGRTGATKLQFLAIGKGTRQHGLIAGKTGSGKSTLFHVIITNLSLWCSPEQVEFYLVDFKKGVEFKCYGTHRLPHARVVAIESDREFGLSVLQKVDDELKRRGDMFRKLGVQDIAGYKRAGGKEAVPRSLLLIDEFQEFFVEDDKISQTASLLLDRIVRQGRAFGIHVLLGSQTLGGAYTVARTTLGQMVIRIALQCNEADAYLIMDESNPAPRLLSRPGEGIYNDTAGTLEGNSPFQVVWLPDQERDGALSKVRQRGDQNGKNYPGPFVFEGNAPAEIRENLALQQLLETRPEHPPSAARIWLGAPNSIKGPTEALFHRQSGNNLLLIGQREEATLAIFCVGLLSLAAQYPLGTARLVLCDATPPGSPPRDFLERLVRAIPHPITLVRPGELPEIMKGLVDEMNERSANEQSSEAGPIFLFIHGMQRFNKLRYEEDFGFSSSNAEAAPNPSALLNTLLTEGTRFGFHVIASCDTYNNVNRFLNRKALSEFEMRVLFQMSANDSASLIDNPKASTLGLHRALYYNEQQGYLETFRPYALPAEEWISESERKLASLLKPSPIEAQSLTSSH